MNFLILMGMASLLVILCFAGLAIGLIIRNKNIRTCGCGRGHNHNKEAGCLLEENKRPSSCPVAKN